MDDGHFLAHLLQQRHDVGWRHILMVQQHVEQGKFNLAQRLHAALKVLRRQHLVEERARQGLAAIDMRGHVLQHLPLPAEIFHELARQFHRIPLHPADARDTVLVHLREHVV